MTLDEYFKLPNAMSQIEMAEYCGVTPGMISHIATGKRRPSSELARKIELATGDKVLLADFFPNLTKEDLLALPTTPASPETPSTTEEQVNG